MTYHFIVGNTHEGCGHEHKSLLAAVNCLVKISRKAGGVVPNYNVWRISYSARGKRQHEAAYQKSTLHAYVQKLLQPELPFPPQAILKHPTMHWVASFSATVGRTFCGILSNNVTAYANHATCLKCRSLAKLHGHLEEA